MGPRQGAIVIVLNQKQKFELIILENELVTGPKVEYTFRSQQATTACIEVMSMNGQSNYGFLITLQKARLRVGFGVNSQIMLDLSAIKSLSSKVQPLAKFNDCSNR